MLPGGIPSIKSQPGAFVWVCMCVHFVDAAIQIQIGWALQFRINLTTWMYIASVALWPAKSPSN